MYTKVDSDYLISIANELHNVVDALFTIADDDNSDEGYTAGTIVKAKPDQTRFKKNSMWVSLGGGKYKHLTGSKGLIANYDRLNGYVDVVYLP